MVIDEKAWRLLDELHHGLRGPNYELEDRERIRALGEMGQPAVLSTLLPLASDLQLSEAVAAATRSLLRGRSALELAELDPQIRRWPAIGGQILAKWAMLSAARLPELTSGTAGAWVAAALCSHSSGWVRLAAVNILGSAMISGEEIPFLLIRLNDWVEPVRQAAGLALLTRIQETHREFWLDCLPLLERIPGRPDQQTILETLRAFCCRPHFLEAAMLSPEASRRACAFRMGVGHFPDEELLGRAFKDDEQAIQIWATRQLSKARVSQEFVLPLLSHVNPAVRVAALMLTESNPPEQMLLDSSPRVREATRRRLAGSDFVAFYRNHLDCKAGVAGLGEVGGPADASLLLPLSQNAALARSVVKAVGRLDADAHCNFLAAFLSHPQPGVAREAFLAVRPLASRLLGLCQRLARAGPPHSRRLALMLLEGASKWESVGLLVELRHDPEVGEQAEKLLQRWLQRYNRRQTPPTPAQLLGLRQLPDLPPELLAILKALP